MAQIRLSESKILRLPAHGSGKANRVVPAGKAGELVGIELNDLDPTLSGGIKHHPGTLAAQPGRIDEQGFYLETRFDRVDDVPNPLDEDDAFFKAGPPIVERPYPARPVALSSCVQNKPLSSPLMLTSAT